MNFHHMTLQKEELFGETNNFEIVRGKCATDFFIFLPFLPHVFLLRINNQKTKITHEKEDNNMVSLIAKAFIVAMFVCEVILVLKIC